jgi:hypothetical protein
MRGAGTMVKRADAWRLEEDKERAVLQELLSSEQSRVIIAEFQRNGIGKPSFEDGEVYVDQKTGVRYASLPFRATETGEVHATLESIDNHVQGVYVSLAEAQWGNFNAVVGAGGRAVSHVIPWTAFREPSKTAALTRAVRDKGLVVLRPSQRDIAYKGLYLMGAARIAFLNKLMGYYMMIAVCAM